MTEILRFEEAQPAAWPDLILVDGEGNTEDTGKPDPAIWARLESYIAYRWTPRQCVWTVQGPGDWRPHLAPVSSITVDQWDDVLKVWETASADQSALGYYLPRSCVYRITATVGADAGQVPQPVVEAHRRLLAYSVEAQLSTVPAGVSSHSLTLGDGFTESVDISPSYAAKALQNSGAADLLRSWRGV
tara:strand:- start:2299 stop:2862 length:564 start_codon:yes stop_codon:yes gene_type:complete